MSCYIPPRLPSPAPASLVTQQIEIIPDSQTDKRSRERKNTSTIYSLQPCLRGCTVEVFLGRRGEKDSWPCYEHSEQLCPHSEKSSVKKTKRFEEETSSGDHSDRTILKQKGWRG